MFYCPLFRIIQDLKYPILFFHCTCYIIIESCRCTFHFIFRNVILIIENIISKDVRAFACFLCRFQVLS